MHQALFLCYIPWTSSRAWGGSMWGRFAIQLGRHWCRHDCGRWGVGIRSIIVRPTICCSWYYNIMVWQGLLHWQRTLGWHKCLQKKHKYIIVLSVFNTTLAGNYFLLCRSTMRLNWECSGGKFWKSWEYQLVWSNENRTVSQIPKWYPSCTIKSLRLLIISLTMVFDLDNPPSCTSSECLLQLCKAFNSIC